MANIPGRDPVIHGPSPLLTERDRPALERLIDRLQADITREITTRIPQLADPLFEAGYRADELQIEGFGNEIEVLPKLPPKACMPVRLWWRRVLIRLHLKHPPLRDYRNIDCDDHDTARLIKGLNLFLIQGKQQSSG